MKQKISLGSSISILIGVVIAILALVRGPVQTGLLLVTFALWGLWVVLTLLRPAWRSNRAYRTREEREAREQDALSGRNVAGLLLCHVNYRVSDYLKSAYPNARWEWVMQNPILHFPPSARKTTMITIGKVGPTLFPATIKRFNPTWAAIPSSTIFSHIVFLRFFCYMSCPTVFIRRNNGELNQLLNTGLRFSKNALTPSSLSGRP